MNRDERWLDELLSHPEPYVEDDGFSARVAAALPHRSAVSRQVPVLLAVLLSGLASIFVPVLRESLAAVGSTLAVLGDGVLRLGFAPSPAGAQAAAQAVSSATLPAMLCAAVVVVLMLWGGVELARAGDR